MVLDEPGSPPRAERKRGFGVRFLRVRILVYALVLAALAMVRFTPGFRARLASFRGTSKPPSATVLVAGLDLAPVLIPQLADDYRRQYSWVDLRILGGGSRQALEDLVNGRVAVAFMNRLPTEEEKEIISTVVDSVETYPIALGGIAILSAKDGNLDSLTTVELVAWLTGGPVEGRGKPERFYVPDPNLGLWAALAGQLGLTEDRPPGVVWLADEMAVVRAVAADASSIGFSSTLSLPADLDPWGVRRVRVRGPSGTEAVLPGPGEIGSGDYPLYHYLYVAFLPEIEPTAAGFVTFLYSPLGQRRVEHAGALPARQAARIVQLAQEPLGGK
jgi:ABC-type phosphate transport system substrate-binding protein